MTACRQPTPASTLRTSIAVILLVLFHLAPCRATAQLLQRSTAFQGARILTMDGREITDGTLVITGQKIRAVGAEVKLPALAKKIDASGMTITPGFIDVGSVLGRVGGRSTSGSATQRAEDAFDRYDTRNLVEALSHGVTAVFLSPLGPTGICGTGAVIRLARRSGDSEKVGTVLKSEAALCIDLRSANKAVARLKTLQAVHKAFAGAQQYRRSLEAYEEDVAEYAKKLEQWAKKKKADDKKGDDDKKGEEEKKKESPKTSAAEDEPAKKPEAKKPPTKPDESGQPKKPRRPARSLSNEVLLRALDSEIPVRIIALRSSDILNALELAEEFSLDLTLEGATEAHLVADQIAEAEANVVLGRMDLPVQRGNDPLRRRIEQPGAVLDESGIPWVVSSGPSGPARTRFLLLNAQMAAAYSSQHDPLHLITGRAADLLQVKQIGRLRPGMLADFVLWSGDPADPSSKVVRVFVGGQEVYSAGE